MPARWAVLKSNFDNRRRHPASFRKVSYIVDGQLRASWLFLKVRWLPCRHGRSSTTANTTVRNFLCVWVRFFSLTPKALYQWTIGLSGPSGCTCSNKHSTSVWQASAPMVKWPVIRGSMSTGGLARVSLNSSIDCFCFVVNSGRDLGWTLSSFLFSSATVREHFGTNRQRTLQRPKKDCPSVCIIWFHNSQITFCCICNLPPFWS